MSTVTTLTGTADPPYLLRRDDAETQRLVDQSRLFDPFMRRLLGESGIESGMTVLDVGSGAGDVSLLLAERVGRSGRVIGIDTDATILETAKARVASRGLSNVSFIQSDCRTLDIDVTFDAVVGRLVLLYMGDAAACLKSMCAHIRSGGIVAFQDINTTLESVRSHPSLPVWEQLATWAMTAIDQAGLHRNMGFALRRAFLDAGLPEPHMRLESAVGGGQDWNGYAYFADTIRSMAPKILQSGRWTEDDLQLDTLADRFRDATIAADAVVKTPDIVSAWTRKR